MTEEKFDLDRETRIESCVDAFDKQWVIKQQRGRALYFARPNPDREDAVIPKIVQGLWTKVELLKTAIDKHVLDSYVQADKANQKAERKRQVAREANKAKSKNDAGSTDNKESATA